MALRTTRSVSFSFAQAIIHLKLWYMVLEIWNVPQFYTKVSYGCTRTAKNDRKLQMANDFVFIKLIRASVDVGER